MKKRLVCFLLAMLLSTFSAVAAFAENAVPFDPIVMPAEEVMPAAMEAPAAPVEFAPPSFDAAEQPTEGIQGAPVDITAPTGLEFGAPVDMIDTTPAEDTTPMENTAPVEDNSPVENTENEIDTLEDDSQIGSAAVAGVQTTLDFGQDFQNSPDIDSMQLLFAKLQLEQAEINKKAAEIKMQQIAADQEAQREIGNLISIAWNAKTTAESEGGTATVPAEVLAYLENNNISGVDVNNVDEAMSILNERMEELGQKTRQDMTQVQQTYLSQYNYAPSGNQLNSTQTIRSLSRGQSMYGDSQAGLAVTGLVVGLVLGCALTLAVQKLRRKKNDV